MPANHVVSQAVNIPEVKKLTFTCRVSKAREASLQISILKTVRSKILMISTLLPCWFQASKIPNFADEYIYLNMTLCHPDGSRDG